MVIVGIIIVIASVMGGYLMAHGNLYILFQPAEFLIIVGAVFGGFIISSPSSTLTLVRKGLGQIFRGRSFGKKDYLELLLMLNDLFGAIRRMGLRKLEDHIDNPHKSDLFKKYPRVFNNKLAFTFIIDILRSFITSPLTAHELESLLDNELESVHEEYLVPARSIGEIADALPGIGIVAAVLGIVITMGKMSEPPEVLGHSIGAALVGTFLGILLSYGFVGPMSKKLERLADENRSYLDTIRVAFVAFTAGTHYSVATEFGRRVVPPSVRPSFDELEKEIRKRKPKSRAKK